ncbi:uncharacterized protein ACNLHF_022662 [Anomaloglossus baeobatrachus]
MDAVTSKIQLDFMEYSHQANMLAYRVAEEQHERRRLRRRFWIHPINSVRMSLGVFNTLCLEMRSHPEKFHSYVRMSGQMFDVLVEKVDPFIRRMDTFCRMAIPPAERLMITLRFLATGESFASLHFQFRIGKSTIAGIVITTCQALWDSLHSEYIPHPTEQDWLAIASKYQEICQFPNCIGAVDGKHIRIIKPARSGSEYFNYKKYFSIVLMAIADAEYKFIAVDIGAYGKSNDSQVFKLSAMGRNLYGNSFSFPAATPLPNTDGPPMPFVCVGDEAFQLDKHLMKPFSSRALTHTRKIFNYRLSRARRMVECAFGILTAKWRVLTSAINLKVDNVDHVVKACVVLHNYLLSNGDLATEEQVSNPLPEYRNITFRSSQDVLQVREQFAAYFVSPVGRLDWQDQMV